MIVLTPRVASGAVVAVAIGGAALALGMVVTRPVELTMPIYADLAAQLTVARRPASFEPLGYPWLLSLLPAPSITAAVTWLHLACYAILVAVAARLARTAIDESRSPLRLAAIVMITASLLANPYIVINLVRINDNGVNVLMSAALFALLVRERGPAGRATLIAAAATLGLWMFVRPNVLSLLPLVVYAALRGRTMARAARELLIVAATVALVYGACSWSATGGPWFWPDNGAYNVLAGNNPGSLPALRREYNAEASLPSALSACGIDAGLRAAPDAAMLACARKFAAESPGQAAHVTAYKAYTMLFRPNLRLADGTRQTIAQWATLALTIAWWSVTLVMVARRLPVDAHALWFVLLFTAPFALSNADPRFRLPLDPVYAVSLLRTLKSA